jgi:hypothetical protein
MISSHVKIGAFVLVLTILGLCGAKLYLAGYKNGRNALLAEQARVVADKLKGAADEDEISRACSADPACRMRSDGFRRD